MTTKQVKSTVGRKIDKSFTQEFRYRHRNPYHHKLKEFDDFVLRDDEGENYRGVWNQKIFKKQAPLKVEIGSGYGHFMQEYCENHPEVNFVGIDFRFKRSFKLAKKLKNHSHKNFRYLRAKGERIGFLFEENEIDEIFYFFPDPWPKKKHRKKRLFQPEFLKMAHQILKPGGRFLIKTDHSGYSEWIKEEIDKQDLFKLEFMSQHLWKEHPLHELCLYKTKFEKIFLEKNKPIYAFILINS